MPKISFPLRVNDLESLTSGFEIGELIGDPGDKGERQAASGEKF